MFKPLPLTPVSRRSMAALFGSRSLRFVCSVIVVLLGFLASAVAQDKDKLADSQPSASAASTQTLSGDQSQTQAAPVGDAGPEQRLVHIVPYGRGTNASTLKNTFAPSGAHLFYFGGPVISNVHVVVVFWGTNVDPVVTTPGTIDQFFADITNSRYYDLLTEYSTAGVTGVGTPVASSNQTIGRGEFDATVTIIPSSCPGPATCTLTDNQIQAELTSQLAAGHLPAPVKDAQGIIETFYMIYFPPGVHISLGGAPSCAAGGFCAYHSNTSNLVPYGVLPDFGPASGCQAPHCGNGTEFQNITAVTSHEMSEAVTDAQVGSATVFGPPLAWYDHNPPAADLAEIGDICTAQDVTVSAGAHTYTVQQEFSNVQNDCVSAPPVFNLSAPTAGAGPSLPFNGTLTIQSSVSPFTLAGYTGTVHFTSSDSQAVLPADYTFLSTDAGSHQFSFTLKTLGNQTITVTDTHSAGFTGTATVNVNTTPDLTISKNHTGNFSVGQTGATYTITVSNTGHGPTSGTVTVVDTLPSALTATAISGTGWTCTLGTLTCTRADALAASSSYPAITLTVNVAANAPSSVTNSATVSGGGDVNVANNTANDPTTILIPDLTISKSHSGPIFSNFFQGETGATYTITVQNIGTLATFGTVTVVDTLPPTGLNPTAISGTGWTCTLATLTCTRSDALAGGFTSYPPITLTVDVPLGAPGNVTNTATVSGGGEVNTGNDVAQDFTTILPPPTPDLSIGVFHTSSFVQGQTGTYVISVTNVGTKITSGTVIVTDTLPTGLTATSMTGTGWICSLGNPLTCSRSDALDFGLGYPQIDLTVNVAPDAPATVTNTVTVMGGGDSNSANNTAQAINSVVPPLIDLRPLLGAQLSLTQGQTNVPQSISVANFGNVASSGLITLTTTFSAGLTATSITGPGWNCTLSNLTCTRPDSIGAGVDASSVLITYNVANNAPASGSFTTTVSGGGNGAGNNTVTSSFQITPMVVLLSGTDNIAVSAGQPALFNFFVNVFNQAAGTITFTCSGLPTASSCSFSPQSLTTSGSVNMTINTTASSTVVGNGNRNLPPDSWLIVFLLTAAMLSIGSLRRQQMRLKRLGAVFVFAGMLLIAMLSGCGGGGTPPPITHTVGTPPGTYAITVTGTSANGTTTHVFNLTVR